jgi:hypothetical protein
MGLADLGDGNGGSGTLGVRYSEENKRSVDQVTKKPQKLQAGKLVGQRIRVAPSQ